MVPGVPEGRFAFSFKVEPSMNVCFTHCLQLT